MRYLVLLFCLLLVCGWLFLPYPEGVKMHPRWLVRVYAATHNYFWLPCPICGEPFAGMEWAADLERSESRQGSVTIIRSVGVCPDCVDEAHRRNTLHRAKEEGTGDGS